MRPHYVPAAAACARKIAVFPKSLLELFLQGSKDFRPEITLLRKHLGAPGHHKIGPERFIEVADFANDARTKTVAVDQDSDWPIAS
jgi:hypothetical protein